jgi:uncharacterized protein YaeQ
MHPTLNPPMALKSTIYKAALQIADMDRQVYREQALTLALHPSETEERLMVRLLAFALQLPATDFQGELVFARGLSDSDEPDLWRRDLTGELKQWVEVGQPDERRLQRACSRSDRVALYCYSAAASIWWNGIRSKLTRLDNLDVWRLDAPQSQALASLADRSMQWQVTIQDGHAWVHAGGSSVELQPIRLQEATR